MLAQQIDEFIMSNIEIDRCEVIKDDGYFIVRSKSGGPGGIIAASIFLFATLLIAYAAFSNFSWIIFAFAIIFCPLLIVASLVFLFATIEKKFDLIEKNAKQHLNFSHI